MIRMVMAVIVPVLFLIGCGGSDDSEGGFSRTNDYETRSLRLSDIQGSYMLEQDEGLNFSIFPQLASAIEVDFYSQEGNLSIEHIAMDADGAYSCSNGSFTGSCRFENSVTGEEYTFSIANLSIDPVSFKLVAYQGDLSEGSESEPLEVSVEESFNGQVGYRDKSYYRFEAEGGAVTITVRQTDTMNDIPEKLFWRLADMTTGSTIGVTDMDGNISSVCQDAYGDENVSCETDLLSSGSTYRIEVENRGEGALIEYKILVSGE